MKRYLLAAPLLFCAAAPAHATAGFFCETQGAGRKISVNMVYTMGVGGALIDATLTDNGKDVKTEKALWWIDAAEVRLLLTDPNVERIEVEIRAVGRGDYMYGTLKRGGRTYRVRCEESG